MKRCIRCKLEKEYLAFPKSRSRKDGHYPYCRKCNSERYAIASAANPGKYAAQSKQYRKEHPEAMLKADLKRHFGITVEEYKQMIVKQNGLCAICNQPEKNGNRISLDHDHKTGKNRELLCNNCNMGIGRLKESEEILLSAISYLKKHGETS